MKKNRIICLLLVANLFGIQAKNEEETHPDTIQSKYLDEIIVSGSTKETNPMKTLPGSVSYITSQVIEGQKIVHIKDLSTIIPNFFIPDYGSKLSVPVYIRGIGERSTGQSIGMYVDNMPYLDKSVFDFDFMDVSRIEVLRGPQGTLYGRNARSGIVKVTTNSPLHSQYRKLSLETGNYGLFRAKGSVSELLTEDIGISLNGYYNRNDGYFTNQFTGKKADGLESGGVKIRLDWKINPYWTAQWATDYDHSNQGAFPYGSYENQTISAPYYNYPGRYERQVAGSQLNLKFENEQVIFNSNTGFQWLDDDMKMDVDNNPSDIFRLNQLQKEKSWTEELTLKSNTKNNYQWSFGVFGFYTDLKTNVVTTMGADGIQSILQPVFTKIHDDNPRAPIMTIKNREIPIPASFKTPVYGGAIFHQSTYNHLFIEGLSLTAGIRLDYETTRLNYDTGMDINLDVAVNAGPNNVIHVDSTLATSLTGKESMRFTEILPKAALKYEFNPENYIYATVASGYKTGGYNIQNFADIIQDAAREKYDKNFQSAPVKDLVSYQPEYSWNYEIGFKGELLKDFLYTELAAFYIDVKDIQITDFVESGQGRILKNAGKARSAGFDLSLTALITEELKFTTHYGFTHAVFKNYIFKDNENDSIDYSGNFIPFAPQNTLSASAVYNKILRNKWIDRFNIQVQYNGAGKIYWTEANDIRQDFYGLLNVRAGVNKGLFGINVWANNVLNTRYTAFYFESMQQKLAQAGKPFTFGIEATVCF